jgi:hypothetical protein
MGGKSLSFNSSIQHSDSIPYAANFVQPGDFGGITFTHSPTNDTFFNATIIWMGCGRIYYPQNFDSASALSSESITVPCPDSSSFQYMGTYPRPAINYNAIWSPISHLTVTSQMMAQNCKIGIYPYTPSVGLGNPNQWSWIIFLYK